MTSCLVETCCVKLSSIQRDLGLTVIICLCILITTVYPTCKILLLILLFKTEGEIFGSKESRIVRHVRKIWPVRYIYYSHQLSIDLSCFISCVHWLMENDLV